MANDEKPTENKSFKPIMAGLAIGSGMFLFLRYAFQIDVDFALPIGTFFAVAAAIYLLNRPTADKG